MENKNPKIIPFRQKARDRRAITVFAGVLAVLVLVLAFFVVDGGRNWDTVRRFLVYGRGEQHIDRGSAGHWALWNGRLVTAGQDGVVCYTPGGDMDFVASAELSSPELIPGNRTLLAYSAGGSRLLLLKDNGEVLLERKDTGPIFDAHMSTDGAVCYLTGGERDKTVLQVYDRRQLNCYTVHSDTRYLARCAVSNGAKYVCAVALTEEDGIFQSVAVIYNTDHETPVAEVPLGNQMIYDVRFWDNNCITLVGDSSLITLNPAGDMLSQYAYDDLLAYTLYGEDFSAIAVGDENGDNLLTFDQKGNLLANLPLQSREIRLTAGGKYLALLSDDLLVLGNRMLSCGEGQTVSGVISGLCVGDPGVCYVLDSRGATRYLP